MRPVTVQIVHLVGRAAFNFALVALTQISVFCSYRTFICAAYSAGKLESRLRKMSHKGPDSSSLFSTFGSFFMRQRQRFRHQEATMDDLAPYSHPSFCQLPNSNRKSLLPLSRTAARLDHPESWRLYMGGHDPATPMAEAYINLHNHSVMWMLFVVSSVFWPLRCRH